MALLMLSPMLFIDVASFAPGRQANTATDAEVVSLPPRPQISVSPALTSIYDWLDISDPTVFILPDVDMGFARFRSLPSHEFRAALPSNVWKPDAVALPEIHAIALPIRASSLNAVLLAQWPRDTPLIVPALPQWQTPSGIFWRDQRGRLVIDPPIIQPDFISQAINDHGQPQHITLLEIDLTPLLPMPRTVIRQSCGNVKLDELLLDAIRDYFQRQPFHPTTAGPRRARKLLLEIDWRLPITRS